MKVFARITAVIFMLLGVGIILFGAVFALSSLTALRSMPTPSAPSLVPNLTGLVVLVRIIGGGAIGIQGLFIAAIGQVLWMLIIIADQTEKTSEHIDSFVRRLSQSKQ